jgi:hypothetical protein
MKFWWNPLGISTKSTILYRTASLSSWTDYNRLILFADTTYAGPDLRLSASLFNTSTRWNSAQVAMSSGWKQYMFDLSSVPQGILSGLSRVELNFTGVDSAISAFVDDFRLSYHKAFDEAAYINQTLFKENITATSANHVILTFDYSIFDHKNIQESSISVWLNGTKAWTMNITSLASWTSAYVDISQYMSAAGQYSLSFMSNVRVDSPYEIGFGAEFDNVSLRAPDYNNGTYTSGIYDASGVAIWKDLQWDEYLPIGTNITVQTRRGNSTIEVTFASWSPPLSNSASESIYGFNSSMIQYKVNLNTINASMTPVLLEMNLSYQKYAEIGYVETGDFVPVEQVLNWGTFDAVRLIPPNSDIRYWISTNSGLNWNPILPSDNVVATLTSPVRLKADLTTLDTSQSPVLSELNITYMYFVYSIPVITPKIPNQSVIEDFGPWTLDLSSFAVDDSPQSALKWYVTGSNDSMYTLSGDDLVGNHVLSFSTKQNVFGNDFLTIWLEDPLGLRDSQGLWINITPVNDAPSFVTPPNLNVKTSEDYSFDYSPYISDLDNTHDELILSIDDENAIVNGLNVTYSYPISMENTNVSVTLSVSDGTGSAEVTISVNVVSDRIIAGWDAIMSISFLGLALLAVLMALLLAIPSLRNRKQEYSVEDIFLIHKDGRLIAHYTRELVPDRDEDILSGMLTAVQEFIKDSMSRDEILRRFDFQFQERKVLVERGENTFLAVFLKGVEPSNTREQLKAFVEDIEIVYAGILPQWSGDVDAFTGLKDLMDVLLVGKGYRKGHWKKMRFMVSMANHSNSGVDQQAGATETESDVTTKAEDEKVPEP